MTQAERPTLTIWPNNDATRTAWSASIQNPDGRSVMTASVRSYAEATARADAHGYRLDISAEVLEQMVAAGVG